MIKILAGESKTNITWTSDWPLFYLMDNGDGVKVYLTFSVSTSIFILTQKSSRSHELLNANRDDYDDGRFVGGMIETCTY